MPVHRKPHFTRGNRTQLLYLVALAPLSHAQDTTMGTSPSPISFITSVVTSLPSSSTLVLSSSTTLATSIVAHRTTSSIMYTQSSHTPLDPFLAGSNPTTDRSDHDEDESVFNYYFLFLAVLGVLVGLLLWWLHWRRKQRKARMRRSGQDALARDLEGWTGTRRFYHGSYGRHQVSYVRRQEGLDEHGEAPPPYQSKSDTTVDAPSEQAHGTASSLAIPLRTLPRDEGERARPPGYAAITDSPDSVSTRQDL
jgi:hypothetical protein